MRSSIVNGVEIIIPEGMIKTHEQIQFAYTKFVALKCLVRPGSVVFDIGSSYGISSSIIASLCGPNGFVVGFEGNDAALKLAAQIADSNSLFNIQFVDRVVTEKTGVLHDLFVVNEHTAASTLNPEIVKFHPDAKVCKVESISIDDFVSQSGMIPSICNIDDEGSEYVTVAGMRDTITRFEVDIVMETHGDEILGIGGNLTMLLDLLLAKGYRMVDLGTWTTTTAAQYLSKYAEGIGHVLFSKKLANYDFRAEFYSLMLKEITKNAETLDIILSSVQESIDKHNDLASANRILEEILKLRPDQPLANYLYAFSLHMLGLQFKKAVEHYGKALQYGFDEFWVRYNRGSLYAQIGRKDEARTDIQRAISMRPNHAGCLYILQQIRW